MDELLNELAGATESLRAATANAEGARRLETTAINRLSAAQKAVDAKLASMKLAAPRGSDWHTSARSPSSIGRA